VIRLSETLSALVALQALCVSPSFAQPPGITNDAAIQLLKHMKAEAQECHLLKPQDLTRSQIERMFLTGDTEFFSIGTGADIEKLGSEGGQIRSGGSRKPLAEQQWKFRAPQVVVMTEPKKASANVYFVSTLLASDLRQVFSDVKYVPWDKPYPPALDGPGPNDPGHYLLELGNSECTSELTVQLGRGGGLSNAALIEVPHQ
jgi:hypothetical protein